VKDKRNRITFFGPVHTGYFIANSLED